MAQYVVVEKVQATAMTKAEYDRSQGGVATAENEVIDGYSVIRPNGKTEFVRKAAFEADYLEIKTDEQGQVDATATAAQLVGTPKLVVSIPLANGRTIEKEVKSDDAELTAGVVAELSDIVEQLLDVAENGFKVQAGE